MTDEIARWIILAPAIFCASATLINCYRERTQADRNGDVGAGVFANSLHPPAHSSFAKGQFAPE